MHPVRNDYTSYMILTDHGFVRSEDIRIGDIVRGWNNESYIVKGIHDTILQDTYLVSFSDGRHALYGGTEMLYTGKDNKLIYNLVSGYERKYPTIKLHEFEINNSEIKTPLQPDPYIAGALLIHGSFDIPYINLPLDRPAANNHLCYKYNVSDSGIPADNILTFRWNSTGRDITWEEFFPFYNMYVNTKLKSSPIVPNEYTYGSIYERKQFISGVFDVGFSKFTSPDNITITHVSEERLKCVQRMLWSLGISSRIEYNPNLPDANGREYMLIVLNEDKQKYPGFFYDINSIRQFILLDNETAPLFKPEPFSFKVININKVNKSFMNRIILNEKQAVFVSNDFLPRVSF